MLESFHDMMQLQTLGEIRSVVTASSDSVNISQR